MSDEEYRLMTRIINFDFLFRSLAFVFLAISYGLAMTGKINFIVSYLCLQFQNI